MILREVITEAWRNVSSGTTRASVFALVLAVTCGALGLADAHTVAGMLEKASTFRASGSSVFVLSAEDSIDGPSCERLSQVPGFQSAGAIRSAADELTLKALPSSPIPLREATPGFEQVVGASDSHRTAGGLMVSADVAEMLHVRPGSPISTTAGVTTVASVFPFPEDGRMPELQFAAVTVVPAKGLFDACWAEIWPSSTDAVQLLRLALDPSTPVDDTVRLSQLNTRLGESFDGSELFQRRITAFAAVLSLLLGGFLGYVSIRMRRLEIASARHAGVPLTAQLLQNVIEVALWGTATFALVLPIAVYQARAASPYFPETLWLEARCLVAGFCGALLGAVIATLATREHHLFRYFKAR